MKQFYILLLIGLVCCNSVMKQDQGIERTSFQFIKGICFKDRGELDSVVDAEKLAYNLSTNPNEPLKLHDFYNALYLAYAPWKIQKENFENLRDSFSMKDCWYNVTLLSNDSAQVKAVWKCIYDKNKKDSIELSLIRKDKWLVVDIKVPNM